MTSRRVRWIGDPEPETTEDLTSRGDLRRANRTVEDALTRIAQRLVELSPARLERLQLPEHVVDTVLDAQVIPAGAARTRQLRLVRSALRDQDWSSIQARVDALIKHGVVPSALEASAASTPASAAPQWVARLLGEGDAGIEALLEIAPSADRGHLRQLLRLVDKANGTERRQKAEERLTNAVASALRR